MLQSGYLVFGQSPAWTVALVPVPICRALFDDSDWIGFVTFKSFGSRPCKRAATDRGALVRSDMVSPAVSYCSTNDEMTKSCLPWLFIRATLLETLINRLPIITRSQLLCTKESKLKANQANLLVSR